jgi:hypothetical protein
MVRGLINRIVRNSRNKRFSGRGENISCEIFVQIQINPENYTLKEEIALLLQELGSTGVVEGLCCCLVGTEFDSWSHWFIFGKYFEFWATNLVGSFENFH